jgi:MFS family permease
MFFFMAMEAQRLVRIWIAYDLTDSKIALGLLLAAVATPMMLIAPFGGAIADRVERRNLIVFGQAIVVANEGVILALLVSDQLAFWHLLCTSAVMGCVFPLIMPARAAIVVNIVGKEGVSQAVGLNMAGMNTMRVVGPGVAGYLLYLACCGSGATAPRLRRGRSRSAETSSTASATCESTAWCWCCSSSGWFRCSWPCPSARCWWSSPATSGRLESGGSAGYRRSEGSAEWREPC